MLFCANEMSRENAITGRQNGAAAAFLEDRLAEGRVAFPMTELVAETGLSVVAASNQIRRLRDRVRRVTQPQAFFLIVDPRHRDMGAPPLQWWLDEYFRWLGHPYYLARYCQVDVDRASQRADFLCSRQAAHVSVCQAMKARSRSSR